MNYMTTINIGDLLTRPKFFGFVELEHKGVAVAPNIVLHNTPEKGEHLATLQEFSAGEPVKIHRTGESPASVIARSKKILANPKKYNPISRNCEHTASETIYGIAKSPLVILGVIIVIALAVLLFIFSRRR
jgi:hypothetical protein